MMRARGLLLGGACFATFAAFSIGVSAVASLPGAAVRTPSTAHGVTPDVGSSAPRDNQPSSIDGVAADAVTTRGMLRSARHGPMIVLVPSQTLTGIDPPSGPTTGGNNVVLTGTGFTTATDVNFGASDLTLCPSAPCFTEDSDTQITVVGVPGNGAGGVDVNVVTSGGTTGNLTYTYVVSPTLTSLNPPSGSTLGGNSVVLTGTDFTGATDVNFGPNDLTPCPSSPCFNLDSDTQITVSGVPAHAAGGVSVNVVTPGGTTGNLTYTYVTPPTLTLLNPPSGSTLGGNSVVLTGTTFNTATDVNFGADDLGTCPTTPCFTVDSSTQITVSGVPAHAAGGVSVNVVNPGGTSGNQTYTYAAVPTLTLLTPPNGPAVGGNSVGLTGTNFNTATDVNFGSNDLGTCPGAPCFTIVDTAHITVTGAPPGSGGVGVNVVNPGGTSGNLTYTYVAAPTLTGLAPPSGSTAGGNNVVLTGTNFNTTTDVNFGGTDISNSCGSGTCFVVGSNTQITVHSIPGDTAGPVNVNVVTVGGTSGNQTYTYFAPPTLTLLAPPSGSTVGGNNVVLTGTNFTGATDVNFGPSDLNPCPGAPCFTVGSSISITVTSIPGHAAGGVNVNVVTPGGTSADQTYTYLGPTLTSLAPPSGSTLGGNSVILTGTLFTGATDVNWGAVDISTTCGTGTCFTVNSATQITVDSIPSHGPGGVNVNVVAAAGTTNNVTYTYVTPPPTLTLLNPSSGSGSGGNDVVLTGTNFTGATDVNFGASDIQACGAGTCFDINGPTQITVHNIPSHLAGIVDVSVTTPDGTSGTLPYTYVGPTLTSLLPPSGSTAGGNSVVLTGNNFLGATDVHVGASDLTPCGSGACFTINNDTQITVTMPANTPGIVNVNVTTPGGTTGSLQYTYAAPAPTVTKVFPKEGAPAGGNIVTLTGTDFEAAGTPITSQVTVGTAQVITTTPCAVSPIAPCFTVNTATSITIGFMPGQVLNGPDQVNITVTTPGGTSLATSSNVYTYNALLPSVTELLPRDGATSGDAAISLFGTGFGLAGQDFVTDVFFGATDVLSSNAYPCAGSSAGCFIVVGPTQLDIYTPAGAAGTVDVKVKTPPGTSNAGTADQYTFIAPGAYTAINPFRICDTRPVGNGIGPNPCNTGGNRTLGTGHEVVTVQMTGGQVPSGAQAVVVNITAINHGPGGTYVVAYPAGGSPPGASNINLLNGKVGSNLAIVQLGTLPTFVGEINLFNAIGSADVIVDVEGYFTAPVDTKTGAFHSIPPLRICDSRGGKGTECALGATNNPLIGGRWVHVVLSGVPPGSTATQFIPSNGTAAAAAFNLTAVAGSLPTYLSVAVPTSGDACPTGQPSFSNLNPAAGTALPNRVISNLGPNQDICLYSALGVINYVIDVNGWFGKTSAGPGAFFYSVPPTRICDTRSNLGTRCQNQELQKNEHLLVHVAGILVVPAWDAHAPPPLAVVANLTGVAGTAATFFTLYPADATSPPTASDLNPSAGQVIANLTITSLAQTGGLSTDGNVNLYNPVGSINAILDVAGWFQ